MLLGEAPGKDETAKGRPFVGKTGKELNDNYLLLAGLRRDDVFFCNSIRCQPRFDRDLREEVLNSCAGFHLRADLARVRPDIVVTMGAVANSLVGLNVELHHGRPQMGEILGYKALIWSMYHPALGLHDYAMMNVLMEDWIDLGRYLRGDIDWRDLSIEDEYPEPRYERLRTPNDVLDILAGEDEESPLAIDTEFDPTPERDIPYCLTFTLTPGTGYLIKDEDRAAVETFAGATGCEMPDGGSAVCRKARRFRRRPGRTPPGPVVLHNLMADDPVLWDMGVNISRRRVEDTMVMAYNLCTMPQGLKALAYRLAGMEMLEFDDLVTPYAVEYWVAWVEMVQGTDWPKPEPYMRDVVEKVPLEVDGTVVGETTNIVSKLYKPQGLSTKLKRLMTDYRKNPGPKVFKRLWDWDEREVRPAIDQYGPIPKKSIRMVDDEKALLRYACMDSDATRRVYPILKRRLKEFRKIHNC